MQLTHTRRHRALEGRTATAESVGPLCQSEHVVIEFDAELWIWDARQADSWTFVSLPTEATDEIRARTPERRPGFGSIRVQVTIGGSTWRTSIFPDSGRGGYVLPVKRAVRKAEALDTGDIATVAVQVIED